jgi:hypothetical protein
MALRVGRERAVRDAFDEKARISGVQKFAVRDNSRACQGRGQLTDVRDSLEYGAHLM